jgi:LysR family transcriptional regulator, low CO2-responsive transcriptional regulator
MLNLEWVNAFIVFSEHMSFTHAAKRLHISQPALHVQISKLSEALGVPLYRRRGQRLELTDDGRRVLGFGREVRERTAKLIDDLRMRESLRPVVLCAGEGAYLYLLGEAIQGFLASGSAPLRLLTRDREGTIEAVHSGEAHLGVISSETAPEGLCAERLTQVSQMLVTRAGHRLAAKRVVHLSDLAGERLIVPGPGRPHRAMLAQALQSAGVPWEVAVEANGWELMLRFVELGAGVAVVNGCCRLPQGLVARPMPDLPQRTYDLIQRPGAAAEGPTARLRQALLASRDKWKQSAPPAARARAPRPSITPRRPSAAARNTSHAASVPAR